MQGQTRQQKGLKLVDILVTVVIALVFGVIYKLWGSVYDVLKPAGLRLEELTYGMWFIAGIIAPLIIRKPGVAFLAEVAAASVELMIGSEWGFSAVASGVAQGLGAELIFAIFGYKRFSLGIACLAGIASMVGSYITDYYAGYITDFTMWNLTLSVVVRTVSSILVAGVFGYYIVKALEATGVTNLVRPASAEDYRSLEK
jgi:energy-coupling factor transport system substrate-specific component